MRKSPAVLGLHGKVLIVGSYKVGFCEKMLEDFPIPDGVNASCSKRDLLLDEAQHIANNGSALGKNPSQLQRREEKGKSQERS